MPSNTVTAQIKRKIKGHLAYINSFQNIGGRALLFERMDSKGKLKRFSLVQRDYAIEEHLKGVVTGIQKIFDKRVV